MSGTLVIAARELREKCRLFVICAGLAVLPFLVSLLPAARGNRSDVIAAVGGFLSIAVGLGLAVSLGSSTVARELAEKRMSFYFARPVSAAAIWFGKATAALALSVGCFALIAVPAYLAEPSAWRVQWLGGAAPLMVGALVIVEIFLVSHVLSTALRSRSALLALDVALLVAACAVLFSLVRPLLLGGAVEVVGALIAVTVIAASLIVAIAPAWQLAKGRTDLRRGHFALSRFVWIAAGVFLLIAAAAVVWVVAVDPEDLEMVALVEQPRRGPGVLLTGRARNRGSHQASFLMDRQTSAHERLAAPAWWGGRFSDDGLSLFWLKPTRLFSAQLELCVTTLRDGKTRATGIMSSSAVSAMMPSPDGSRVAFVHNRTATVHDVASGKILVAGGRFDGSARHGLFFVSPDVLRVVAYDSGPTATISISELDVRSRKMRRSAEQRFANGVGASVALSGDGSRMLVRGPNVIVDGLTGETIAQLPVTGFSRARSSILHDGSAVWLNTGTRRLMIASRDGSPIHEVAIPRGEHAFIAGEIEGGKIVIVATDRVREDVTGSGRTMLVVDVRRGVVERVVPDVKGPTPRWGDVRLMRYAADQQFVAVDARGKLVTWDPRTGAVRRM